MVFTPETKWNADDQKIKILMEIEAELEEGFLNKDVDAINDFLWAYRRQIFPKFKDSVQKYINENFEKLEKTYNEFKKTKRVEDYNKFYSLADGIFLYISQKIKEAGIYYREGKNASHAILER